MFKLGTPDARRASARCRASLLVALLTAHAAEAADDGFNRYRIPCQRDQNKAIEATLSEARSLLKSTIQAFNGPNSTTGQKFNRWLGGQDGKLDPKVKTVYQETLGFLSMKMFWCPNASFPDDDPGTYAFVPVGSFNEIFLEAKFFDAPDRGFDSKAGTIIHEASHQSTQANIVDTDITGDSKPDYGTAVAEQLAKKSPAQARQTADNLQYFVEDLLYSTKPAASQINKP